MKLIAPYLGVAALIVITLIGARIQGKQSNRWGIPEDVEAAKQRVEQLQTKLQAGFGDRGKWKLVKTTPMTNTVVSTLECQAYINGSFVNTQTNERVNGFIVLGPPGPISVHTPEVCYSSRDYERKEERQPVKIFDSESQPDEFWALTMRRTDVNADILRVYYAWTSGGHWTAPVSPRTTYGGQTKLFKMQLAATLPPDVDLEKNDVCRKFLQAVVPVVNSTLFAAPTE